MASTKVGKKGEAKSMNRWLRARVVAQGATIAAIVGGSYVYGHTKQQQEARQQQLAASAEELRLKEKLEFEARLKAAEETHELEQALEQAKTAKSEQRGGLWTKLGWSSSPQDASVASAQPSQLTSAAAPVPPSKPERTASNSANSWSSWFGWRSSDGPKSDADKKV